MGRKTKFYKILTLAAIMILIVTACENKEEISLNEETLIVEESIKGNIEHETKRENGIYVYICGQVNNPGVYLVEKDARIYQVVEAAGGMTKKAKKNYLNLAEMVTDGQQIEILSKKEYKKLNYNNSAKEQESNEHEALININTATVEELQQISGIGETKANAIVEYRKSNGGFENIEDIKNVSGIGDATFEQMKSQITTS